MSRTLELLAVGGFRIQVGDGSDYWKLIQAIDDIDNVNVTEREWDTLKDDDLIGKDAVVCYSWGVASVFKAFDRLKAKGTLPPIPVLVIMAGVPRGIGQCVAVTAAGGWSVPDTVGEAVCLQVDSFPVSHPIANSGPTRINLLITGIPGNDHVGIQDFPAAHDIVVNVVAAEATALAAV